MNIINENNPEVKVSLKDFRDPSITICCSDGEFFESSHGAKVIVENRILGLKDLKRILEHGKSQRTKDGHFICSGHFGWGECDKLGENFGHKKIEAERNGKIVRNCFNLQVLLFDFDNVSHEVDLVELSRSFEPLSFMWNSWSHGVKGVRFKIAVPISDPVSSYEYWGKLWDHFNSVLKRLARVEFTKEADSSARGVSQSQYTYREGNDRVFCFGGQGIIDTDAFIRENQEYLGYEVKKPFVIRAKTGDESLDEMQFLKVLTCSISECSRAREGQTHDTLRRSAFKCGVSSNLTSIPAEVIIKRLAEAAIPGGKNPGDAVRTARDAFQAGVKKSLTS